ncbi:S46 family peptidase [Sphingomonas sp. MMS24-J13]|uniref:S46 family peptidase n=1 Tax=Sphingomonas sp. MMS24-J13 TaxID=3238686 RepID=UPI00384FA5C7
MKLKSLAAGAALLSFPLAAAHADEGMWTFDNFPAARVAKAYGSAPDKAWLDRVQTSALRLTDGCSSSLVSGEGLLLTNHHCVVGCVQAVSSEQSDYVKNGFLAATLADERKCPGQQAEVLTAITDVTGRVLGAIGTASGAGLAKARDAEVAAIEKAACKDPGTERCQVVTLFGGGQYKLYRYRKYSDVRLVWAPEYATAQFGGDPDNFNFPRYGLDASFLRIYENGKPVKTPSHLTWAARAPVPGELIFAVGNPGSTQRLFTTDQLALQRDVFQPGSELYLSELRGRLIGATAGDVERTRTAADQLEVVENSFKARYGMWQSLLDPTFWGKLDANERDLRARVAKDPALNAKIGDPWGDLVKADTAYRNLFQHYVWLETRAAARSTLFDYARTIVRAATERAKPNADRLPAYSDGALPLAQKKLLDAEPIYPWLEELDIGYWLSKTREYLTSDAPEVQHLLGKESPEGLAHRLVSGTALADPKVRQALFDGGLDAVRASKDPLIQFVLATDPDARAVLDRYRFEVEAPTAAAQSKIAQARFAVYGTDLYPDATFTLRITYGSVQGWTYQGQTIAPTTNWGGMFDRATGSPPYALAPKTAAAMNRIDRGKVLDFSGSLDVVGGNSGSPVIARDGSVLGALFDGNIHSLGGSYGYDPAINRAVMVSTVAVEEALDKIYPAPRLVNELHAR